MKTKMVANQQNPNGIEVPCTSEEESYYQAKETKFLAEYPQVRLDQVRVLRDKLLQASDFTQVIDRPDGAIKTAWADYRKKLRDITEIDAMGRATGVANADDLHNSYDAKYRNDNPVDDGKWPKYPKEAL